MRGPLIERFADKVLVMPDGCWHWQAWLDEYGYGRIRLEGKAAVYDKAHRVAYELFVGPIPKGLTIDHLCRVPACVNPSHLEPVTLAENILRGEGPSAQHARKTHCDHGHEFTSENTYRNPRGSRECRICRREVDRRRNARHKERFGKARPR